MSTSSNSQEPARPSEWATYRRLLQYAYPYRKRLLIGLLFGILFGGSTGGVLVALKGGLSGVFGGEETEIHRWLKPLIGAWFEPGDPEAASQISTIGILILLPLFAIFRGIGFFISKYYVEWVGHRVIMDIRNHLFSHLNNLSLQFISGSRTGELMSRTTNDTQMVERAVSSVIGDLIREPFVLIAAFTVLLMQDLKLAGLSLVVFPLCIVPVTVFGRRVRRFAREGQAHLADLASIQQEAMSGARIVKAFGMESFETERFNQRSHGFFRRQIKVTVARAAVTPLIELLSIVGACLVLLYASSTGLPWYELVTFLLSMILMYDPAKKLSRIHLSVQQSSAAADRIFEILDSEITVKDLPNAKPLTEEIQTIELKDISFAYDETPVLEDINLTVKSGECIAFVGSSGSGKTTLVGLLPRFYDPIKGQVLFNGQDARAITLSSLRQKIGLVSQDTFLFNDTIFNNIAYGRQDTPVDEVEDAARRAYAHDFIMKLPNGYQSVVGERGMLVSGGQRQRLAIARALLLNPPVLILDEATSALDTESERYVQAALDKLMEGRTVFAIAHRLSTIRHADRILVLEKGRIVQQGTHEELLATKGQYKHLYDLQFVDQE